MSQGEPDTASNPRENCSLAPNEGQENHESQESPDPSFHPEDIDEEAELPIPPLQKTISRDNEVHWPPVEAVEAATTPIRKGVLKNSGKLPPVVPGYKSPRKEVRQSPHRRIKKLHRSKTVENADLNGHEHVVTPVSWWGKSINVTLIVCASAPKSNFVTTVDVMQHDPEKVWNYLIDWILSWWTRKSTLFDALVDCSAMQGYAFSHVIRLQLNTILYRISIDV